MLFVVSSSSCVIMFWYFDFYDPTVPQQFFREQLHVTNTTFSRILNKYWAQNEGEARLFDCLINVLFSSHWQALTVAAVIPIV